MNQLISRKIVEEAVWEDQFYMWVVGTVEEGIKILIDVKDAKLQEDGCFEPDIVNTGWISSLPSWLSGWQYSGSTKKTRKFLH